MSDFEYSDLLRASWFDLHESDRWSWFVRHGLRCSPFEVWRQTGSYPR